MLMAVASASARRLSSEAGSAGKLRRLAARTAAVCLLGMSLSGWVHAAAAAAAPSGQASAATPAKASAASATKAGKASPGTRPDARASRSWRTLSPANCKPLDDAEQAHLPASWKGFTAAARRCDLAAPGASSQVMLVSVFAEDYFRGLPASTPWADFPKPLLMDTAWRCLGALPELYPLDEPRTLTLRHGRWVDGIPQEIRVQVANPALGGDYALPTLHWQPAQRRYLADPSSTSESPSCPQ